MAPLTKRKLKMSEEDVNHATRAHMALELRIKERLSYQEIAERCGYAHENVVKQIIRREMERTIVEDVNQLRQQEALTLDILQAECMKLFFDASNNYRLYALDRILLIIEQRRKLFNLDAKEEAQQMQTILVRQVPSGYFGSIEAVPTSQIAERKESPIMEEHE